jgi:hypothetical protein
MNKTVTRTVCCKLDVGGHDTTLAATQHVFNSAATWIAQVCWHEGITNPTTAHHHVYGETRAQFGLGAQLAVCARAKAVEAIKAVKTKKRETCPTFGPRGSVRYDARTYRLMSLDRVSLNTLEGRVICHLLLAGRQRAHRNANEQRLSAHIAMSDMPGRSFSCAPSSATRRRRLARRSLW